MREIKKIDLFASPFNQYGVIDAFLEGLAEALNRHGVRARILTANYHDPASFIDQILADAPDCTLSFNGLLPDSQGRFLADLIKIPHVAFLTDAPNHFFPIIRSQYTILSCVDQNFCYFFHQFRLPNVMFLPHAVNRSLVSSDQPREYEVLMLASFIDCDEIRNEWKKKYGPALTQVLEEAAEKTLTERDTPYLRAFVETLDHHQRLGADINPKQIDYESILNDLEGYIVGKSRLDVLRAIRDVPVHLFGRNENGGWQKYLKNHSNIHIHPEVPYKEALELMKKAKIVINITPQIKLGTHERILSGLMSGAAVLTLTTPFMVEHFEEGKDIAFFGPQNWDEMNRKIQFYLNDEYQRQELAKKGREKVLQFHTWDQRVQTLLSELPAMLDQVKPG